MLTKYKRGNYVLILRRNGGVQGAGRVVRQRPDGRYRVRKAGSNQVITLRARRMEMHPLNSLCQS